MYDWVSHTHNPLLGECPHQCSYCYVGKMWGKRPAKYSGPLRLDEKALKENLGQGNTIFVGNMNDIFAEQVPDAFIQEILRQCWRYYINTYVFQTKNPARYAQYVNSLPPHIILGTTIETNRPTVIFKSNAPSPLARAEAIAQVTEHKTFVTVEPIVDFDLASFAHLLIDSKADFINIGADSKRNDLPEPTWDKVMRLIRWLKSERMEVREKPNLERLKHAVH